MSSKMCTANTVAVYCIRPLSVILLLFFFHLTAIAQSLSFCGSLGPFQAPTNNPDSIVFDRFGNTYLRSDLMGNNSNSVSFRDCSAGYFDLRVDDDIPTDEEKVICQVFSDVSDLIQRRQLTDNCGNPLVQQSIRIEIRQQMDSMGMEDGRLGTASPIYTPIAHNCPDSLHPVVHSNIMRKLNGEILPRGTDGIMEIDIDPPNPYYYGTNPGGITNDQYDLYSIVLHEVMHLIGYSGATGMNGQPNTGFSFYYSAWDRILHTTPAYDPNGNNQNTTPLLSSNCTDNCYQINNSTFATIQDFQEAVNGNCSNNAIDIVVGDMALAPILGGGGNFPNQISHLNPTCGNSDYVMQPSLDLGVHRRTLTDAEINILCALGYETDDCNGCFMAVGGNNIRNNFEYGNCCDLFYTTCIDQDLMIPISTLLCNDFTNGPDLRLTSVSPRNSNSGYSVSITPDSSNIVFSSSAPAYYTGIVYTVEGCDCQLSSGNFAVNVRPCEIECEETVPCQDILCLNGFEDYRPAEGGGATADFYPGEPFWIDNAENNSPDVYYCDGVDNTYIHCGNFGVAGGTEGFAIPVDPPIAPGCSLTLSLDLSQVIDSVSEIPATSVSMLIKGSDQYPCTTVGDTIGANCNNIGCANNTQNYTCIGTVQTTSNTVSRTCPVNWDTHQLTWLNDQSYPINVLIFHPLSRDQPGSGINNLYVDNITASLSCVNNITTTHSAFPQIACSGQQTDIQLSVCAAAGSGQVNLDYSFLLPTGVTLVNGNPSGVLSLTGGNCEQLDFTVAIDAALPPGTLPFELDYTSLGGCASYPFEVPLSRLPDPDFNTLITCGTVELSPVNTDPDVLHFWDFGDGESSTETAPIYTYSNRGNYTITHTLSNSCGSISSSQIITIIDPAPPEAGFMFNIQECSTLVNFFSTTMDSVEHYWDFDGNIDTFESTEANPAFDFQTPGTYTATHIVVNSCDIRTSIQSIIIEECSTAPCDCPNVIEGGDGIALSATSLPLNNLDNTGNCLTINGTLVIDTSYRITGGEIQMQPGSKIIVQSLMSLDLQNVDIHACNQMWQGITVKDFGSLIMRNTMIQDAHWGIKARRWANLNIGKSIFNNNYIGIYTAPTSNDSGQFINAKISTTHFSGTEALLPRYPNQPLTLSDSSRSGVELYNTHSFVIGGARGQASANSFSGLHYGVHLQDCFNILTQRAQMNGLIGAATGVYMDNSVMIEVAQSELSALDYGIRGFRSSPIVLESNIDSRREGVLLQAGRGRSALIEKSNIVSPRNCIYLSDYSSNTEKVEIKECNLFKKDGLDAGAAIFVNNCTSRLIIADNPSIAFSSSGFGIRIANSIGDITVENNPLIYSTGNYWANAGINFGNVTGAQVYNNSINNSGIFALSAFDSPNNLYCCNQVNQARDGVFFGGGCTGTRLKNTDFGQHKYGLNLYNTIISVQEFHGNNWTGANCEIFDALFFSDNAFSRVFQSRFITNRGYVPRGHDFIGVFGDGTPQDWFIFRPEFDPHCTYYCDEPPHLLPPHSPSCLHLVFNEEITDIDYLAVADLNANDDINKGIHNREQHHLLQKLDCLPFLLGQDHDIDQFYQANQQGSSLSEYRHQRKAIQNLFIAVENEELNLLYSELNILVDQIKLMDSTSLSEEGKYLIEQIDDIMAVINHLETENWEQVKNNAETLSGLNHSLVDNEIYEANEKAINQILLNTTAQGIYELDEEQMNTIDEIAAQCPLSGGLAVQQARGLQALYIPLFYDDQSICQSVDERQHSKESEVNQQSLIKAYPNPANQVFHIEIENDTQEDFFIEFWTTEGKAHRQFITKSSLNISLKEWPAGIYLYQVKDKQETTMLQNRLTIFR